MPLLCAHLRELRRIATPSEKELINADPQFLSRLPRSLFLLCEHAAEIGQLGLPRQGDNVPSEPCPAILLSGQAAARAFKARNHFAGGNPPKILRIKTVRHINAVQLKPIPNRPPAGYFPGSPSPASEASGNAARIASVMIRS